MRAVDGPGIVSSGRGRQEEGVSAGEPLARPWMRAADEVSGLAAPEMNSHSSLCHWPVFRPRP